MQLTKMIVFEEKYEDNGKTGSIWVSHAVERDLCTQGSDPEGALRALLSGAEAEELVCAERGCALPGPTPKHVLRRIVGLDTGLAPNREFVLDKLYVMAQRPKMYAQTREAYLMQIAMLLEFGDVMHPMLALMPAAVEAAHQQNGNANADWLRGDLDDSFAAALITAAHEALA